MRGTHFCIRRKNDGVVVIWVALVLLVLIGFIGVMMDTAYVALVGHQLQNAADAASLAGAQKVRLDTIDNVRVQAQYIAKLNQAAKKAVLIDLNVGNAATGDIVVGKYNRQTRTFSATETGADAVQVTAHDTSVALLFGPIFGMNSTRLQRTATAMNVVSPGPAILVLNEDPRNTSPFLMGGDGALTIYNGMIQINSPYQESITRGDSHPEINVSDINTSSASADTGGAAFDGNLNINQSQVDDPLYSLRSWAPPTTPIQSAPKTGDVTIDPGFYPEGITRTNGRLQLTSGIYVLGGGGLQITGGDLIADGVLLYIQNGNVNLRGDGIVRISPIAENQVPAGTPPQLSSVSIMQSPSDTSGSTIEGTDNFSITGTAYFPCSPLTLRGTGDMLCNQIIADTLDITGTPEIVVNYDGRYGGSGTVFLVQ